MMKKQKKVVTLKKLWSDVKKQESKEQGLNPYIITFD